MENCNHKAVVKTENGMILKRRMKSNSCIKYIQGNIWKAKQKKKLQQLQLISVH